MKTELIYDRCDPEEENADQTWRVWVDTERRIVSFHPEEGFRLMEFHSRELYLQHIDTFTSEQYQ